MTRLEILNWTNLGLIAVAAVLFVVALSPPVQQARRARAAERERLRTSALNDLWAPSNRRAGGSEAALPRTRKEPRR